MAGRIVIVAYRPRAGREADLDRLLAGHHAALRAQDLVSDRPPVLMRARDGTRIEVFEWKSTQAVDAAHANPAIRKLWERFDEVCEYVPLSQLEEAGGPFAEFDATN